MTFPQKDEGQSHLHYLNDDFWMFVPPASTRASLFLHQEMVDVWLNKNSHQVVMFWTFPASNDVRRYIHTCLPAIRQTLKFCFFPGQQHLCNKLIVSSGLEGAVLPLPCFTPHLN